MNENTRKDIRKLLRTFGIQADETLTAFIANNPGDVPLQVRITLEDVTDYGSASLDNPVHLVIEGEITW